MKKYFKYAYFALFGMLMATSCTDDYEYDPASPTDQGGNAYLEESEDGTAFTFTPADEQTIKFVVARLNAEEAETISLESDNEKVVVPATVEFAAGEESKEVTATCNVEVGGEETVTVSLADGDGFLYKRNAITFSIQVFPEIPVTYIYGQYAASYPDGFKLVVYDMGNGNYRLPAYGYDYDIDFTINARNQIIVRPQPAWINSNYGDVYVLGNANGDASASLTGSYVAGTFDPTTGLGTITLMHAVPGLGYFYGGKLNDYIIFPVED